MATNKRTVFFVSDSTGITAETFGHSLLSQFDSIQFENIVLRYIDDQAKAEQACHQIEEVAKTEDQPPLVFSTLVDPKLRHVIANSSGLWFDIFEVFIAPLQSALHQTPVPMAGRSHGVRDLRHYSARIDAVNFAVQNDDGVSTRHYNEADIVLIGVSRTGKTPTCLYMALHYGVAAANYPLTEEELLQTGLPAELRPYQDKLFGLTISAERLHRIRSERRPDSRYASLAQCRLELNQADDLFQATHIPVVNTTTMSVEEIATTIMARAGLGPKSTRT
jgi:regulator of PEP synthase PpsR (kinase-PPPase family)